MSLPAYMYIYDENGTQIRGICMALGREGAIEIMNSNYGVYQNTCSNTGKLMGSRQHQGFVLHKEIDKTSPYFAVAVCQSRRLQKAVIHYYDINEAGIEYEIYRVTLNSLVIMSVNASHAYMPGSHTSGMLENIVISYAGIEWFYLEGNIKYDDDWSKPVGYNQQRKQ
uniref:Hcp family type VI secretion system effector n=1 Tax=Scandinavium goeteborgense TaxID=1851514 RepID=UPI00135ADF10|nr:type VI secretion system tube protein TssD [Scandinavium goeteborgense]